MPPLSPSRNIFKKSVFFALIIFLMGATLSACTGMSAKGPPLTADEKQAIIQQSIADKDFLRLFRESPKIGTDKKGTGNYVISDAVMLYINSCCSGKESIIRLLEKNNFKTHVGKDSDIYGRRREGEQISGMKSRWVLPYISLQYKVYISVRNEKVIEVVAHAYHDGL